MGEKHITRNLKLQLVYGGLKKDSNKIVGWIGNDSIATQ